MGIIVPLPVTDLSVMVSFKAEIGTIQEQRVTSNKNELANALREGRRLCKDFCFTARMLKGSLALGRKKK